MNQRKETGAALGPVKSKPEEGSGNFYTGSETFFGVFTQAQVYLSGVRLVHNDKVTQQVSDLASQIENNRRRFLHSGDVNFALQELTRITNSYNQRVQAWESEARRREQNKKTMSGGALAKMKAEFSMVRTKTRLASRTLTKLEVELHQIAGRETYDAKHQSSATADNVNSTLSDIAAPDVQIDEPQPVLADEEQTKAAELLREINLFLQSVVGESLLVSYENADRQDSENPDRIEQVWDAQADCGVPILLAAGWTVKHPNNVDAMDRERKKLDLCFWLIPKSLDSSNTLALVDGQTELWISSRKLDSAKITFRIAAENEFPESDLISGFLARFTDKNGGQSPCLLVASFQNLEWTQKAVVASCSQQQD